MRQTVGTTTLFKIVLAFTFLFAAFLAVAVTYNRVFKLKNEMIGIIEKYEGTTTKSLEIINNYLVSNGYKTKGNCLSNQFGVYDLVGGGYESARNNKQYYYCLNYRCDGNNCKINDKNYPNGKKVYFGVTLFFKFDLPFFGDLAVFKVNGETKGVKLYRDSQLLK